MNVIDKLKSTLIPPRRESEHGRRAEVLPIHRPNAVFMPRVPNGYSSSGAKISEAKTPGGQFQVPGTSSASVRRGTRRKSSTPYDTTTAKGSSSTPRTGGGPPVIIAITEGRGDARGEVGIAAVNMQHPHLILSQISDRHSYPKTLTKILVFNPIEIIMPDTLIGKKGTDGKLYECIKEKFQGLTIAAISRQHFSNANGLDRIKTLCAPEYSSVEIYIRQKFYALAAAGALLKYVEYTQNILYIGKTMKIEFQSSEDTTITDMDVESAQSLGLVAYQKNLNKFTLLGVLDRCLTPGGKRFLRATILQPSCNERAIKERQACVSELVENGTLLTSVQSHIRRLSDVDQLLALGLNTPQRDNVASAQKNLNYALSLKTTLEALAPLRTALRTSKANFLRKVLENLEDPRYGMMMDAILEVLQPEASHVAGFNSSTMQRCFALKSGLNDMLDIARQAYCELIDDMKAMVETLALKYDLPLALACSATLGYHIQMEYPRRSRSFKDTDLPPIFVEVQKHRSNCLMTTEALLVLSQRCKDACEELHLMSNVMLEGMLNAIREHIGCLYRLSNDVTELDVTVSLASISSLPNYTKPTFGSRIDLTNSTHPIMDMTGTCVAVPNDVYASLPHNFNIITGPNMGGKSVYLRQIVMLQIMAQIGCYVPADRAQFRITDRIFCRLCFEDSIECNASSFVLEIKETQYILQTVTSKSLVIVDELCRGTTTEEGESIAFAVCEQLLNTSAFVFFTTHFHSLTQLAGLYPNVTNYHFGTKYKSIEGSTEQRLIYTHKLNPGMTSVKNYGLALAENSGIRDSIVVQARILAAKLIDRIESMHSGSRTPNAEEKKHYDQIAIIQKKIEDSDLSETDVLEAGRKLRDCGISLPDAERAPSSAGAADSTRSSMLSIAERFTRSRHKRLLDTTPLDTNSLVFGSFANSDAGPSHIQRNVLDPMGPSPRKKPLPMRTPHTTSRPAGEGATPTGGSGGSCTSHSALYPEKGLSSIGCKTLPDILPNGKPPADPSSAGDADPCRKSPALDAESSQNSTGSDDSSIIDLLTQLSTDTIEAKITARKKEAEIFRKIEGDQFRESELYGSVFSGGLNPLSEISKIDSSPPF